jgi:hypothetical protein
VRASFWCSQCGCYGHRPAECDEVVHVTRPRTIEELIPVDVRERWGIDTETPLLQLCKGSDRLTLEECEREIADLNTIEVRYPEGSRDSKIREVMRGFKIPTVHKMEDNLLKLRRWAVSNGKKVRLVQER